MMVLNQLTFVHATQVGATVSLFEWGSFPFVCVGILHQFYVSGPTGGVQV